jgi:hypothetical protein
MPIEVLPHLLYHLAYRATRLGMDVPLEFTIFTSARARAQGATASSAQNSSNMQEWLAKTWLCRNGSLDREPRKVFDAGELRR